MTSRSSRKSANSSSNYTATIPQASSCPRRRTSSLRISLGDDSANVFNTNDASHSDVHESSHCPRSPHTSPSFTFDSVRDMLAAMHSPEACNSSVSPSIKRLRQSANISNASTSSCTTNRTSGRSTVSELVRAGQRCTNILSRCLPRHLKRDPAPSPYHRARMSTPSPRDTDSHRPTDATFDSLMSAASFSPTLLVSSPSPNRLSSRLSTPKRSNTVLLTDDNMDLHLFRDEAEYSDYLGAMLTGAHVERNTVVFYELEVHLSQMRWTVLRRFSEFRALRQSLIKHFAKRLRYQRAASGVADQCEICAHMLDAIALTPFPSRQQTHRHWHKLFVGASSPPPSSATGVDSSSSNVATAATASDLSTAVVIADRKTKFSDFVTICLRTVRGLRQHGKVMEDSSACEIGTPLRLIEEFLSLSFARYLEFLSDRGVVGHAKASANSSSNKSKSKSKPDDTKSTLTSKAADDDASPRRLTTAA